ncbi:hypothetical protein [Rhodoblastus sp.]|jgi:hypothetical protein|uniref:hypothetical protein n=1 Tax=Rhodoblastus sp. TaxID=1962975 RepID=UPI0025FEA253|nr:hypothetical protein [Rhodoblastus sp.]
MSEPRTFIEFRPGMRRLIEDAIESLILLLDEIDGDDDLEDGSDDEDGADCEPALGAPERHNRQTTAGCDQRLWAQGEADDREDDDEREPEEGVFYL